MKPVQIIEPIIALPKIHDDRPHRVCAYCRVSTDEGDQRNSLTSQIQFFSAYFQRKPNWIHVGIFADEGLSGTSLEKRDQFNEMLRIARRGEVDIILTKEVSRFSRNAQDLLNIVVELRNRGVYIWFLSDDINTESQDYRERLTQIAANAEQESLRTSRRVKWGHRQQLQRGVVFGRKKMFGYKIETDASGRQSFTVIPEEAEIIRKIFTWYSVGDGSCTIARRLEQMGARTEQYHNRWNSTVILRILRNEKYVGDLAQGKTYTPDPLTHKKKYNQGEYYRYYAENHHLPIIDRTLWNQTQRILRDKEQTRNHAAKQANRYWCSGKVFCGLCGSRYIHITKQQKKLPYEAWVCFENHSRGKHKEQLLKTGAHKAVGCNAHGVNDRILRFAVHDLVEKAVFPLREALIDAVLKEMGESICRNGFAGRKKLLEQQTERCEAVLDELTLQLGRNVITKERYTRAAALQETKILALKKQLAEVSVHAETPENRSKRWAEQAYKIVDLSDSSLNTGLFERITKKIVVHPQRILELHLTGIPEPIFLRYQTRGRGDAYTAVFTVLEQWEFDEIHNNMTGNIFPEA